VTGAERAVPERSGAVRVGVDVGGTTVIAVGLDAAGVVVAEAERATERGDRGVVGSIAGAVAALGAGDSVASIGVGVPGRVDGGRVRGAVNLGVADLDLRAAVAAKFAVPVRVENDVNAAARGAFAGAAGVRAYLNLGTGVAAGLVIDGRVVAGATGTAGEIGHLSVDPAGPECACGQRGCIEAFTGGAAVERAWRSGRGAVSADATALVGAAAGGTGERPPGAVLGAPGRAGEAAGAHPVPPALAAFDAADAGDPRGALVVDRVANGTAAAVRALALSFDPESIAIGGGLSRLGDRLAGRVASRLRRDAAGSPFLASLRLDERFEIVDPARPAGAIGAALSA